MVRPSNNNASPSSPTIASMFDATFDVTVQQSPQATPTVSASYTETMGTTIPANVSSTIPAFASTVDAVAQSNASFGGQPNQSLWAFDPINHRNQPYGMPSSFMEGLHTDPSIYSENLNVIRPQFFHPRVSVLGSNRQQ